MSKTNKTDQEIKLLTEILTKIQHPGQKKDLISSGAVKEITPLPDGSGRVRLLIGIGPDRKTQIALEAEIRTAISRSQLNGMSPKIHFIGNDAPSKPSAQEMPSRKLERVRYVVAVGSGKGGVGKSTVAVNLAAALAAQGLKVGLLDADIYGPSIGGLIGLKGKIDLPLKKNRIIPIEKYKMKIVSFSFLLDKEQAVAWRGPMLGKALEQFLYDVEWGRLDYLIIDLPPGTGDTHLSLGQLIGVHGAVIVTTPQEIAVQDALRAVKMFEQVNIPIIGVVENMSGFVCPHCHQTSEIFSKGGGEFLSKDSESRLLSRIPMTIELMQASEKGIPITAKEIKKLKSSPQMLQPVQEAFGEAVHHLQKILDEAYQIN